MNRIIISLFLVFCVLFQPGETDDAVAQSSPFTLVDESETVDAASLETASQPLVERTAFVGIFIVDDADPTPYMLDSGLKMTETIDFPLALVIFVPISDVEEARIIYGQNWQFELRDIAPEIESEILRPQLAAGEYQNAIVDTLNALEAHLGREIIIRDRKQSRGDGVTPWWLYVGVFGAAIVGIAFTMSVVEMRYYRD